MRNITIESETQQPKLK